MTASSQTCGEKQQGSVFKVGPHLPFLKPLQYYETTCLGTQKIVHLLFCVFQIKSNKAVNIFCTTTRMDQKCTNETRF